jgi:hypothetical protein
LALLFKKMHLPHLLRGTPTREEGVSQERATPANAEALPAPPGPFPSRERTATCNSSSMSMLALSKVLRQLSTSSACVL